MNKNKGFTLIELLVVISIISLLSSIVFASVSSARDKASVVKANVQGKEIEKAIELSRLSSGTLPVNTTPNSISDLNESSELRSAIDPFLSEIPTINNIITDSNNPEYFYLSNGVEAVDSNGNKLMCGFNSNFEVDDSIIYYRSKEQLWIPGLNDLDVIPVDRSNLGDWFENSSDFSNTVFFACDEWLGSDCPQNFDSIAGNSHTVGVVDTTTDLTISVPVWSEIFNGTTWTYKCIK